VRTTLAVLCAVAACLYINVAILFAALAVRAHRLTIPGEPDERLALWLCSAVSLGLAASMVAGAWSLSREQWHVRRRRVVAAIVAGGGAAWMTLALLRVEMDGSGAALFAVPALVHLGLAGLVLSLGRATARD
jgi:hypothetical protein